MKKVSRIPYNETQFYWVDNHWDIHLSGLCLYNNKIHRFITDDAEWYDYLSKAKEEDDIDETKYTIWCDIFQLTPFEKIKHLYDKKLFEICVGTHWSYSKGQTQRSRFYVRKPKWLHQLLFDWFYGKGFFKRFKKEK